MRLYGINFEGTDQTQDGTGLRLSKIASVIPQLPQTPTIGLVMFIGISPKTYLPICEGIKKAGGKVLLRVCDSYDMDRYQVSEYRLLYRAALSVLSPVIDIVECANEINGSRPEGKMQGSSISTTGPWSYYRGPDIYQKLLVALQEAETAKISSAVTLYWNNDDPDWTWEWVKENPFHSDFVLMSDYPNSTPGTTPTDLSTIMTELSAKFPKSYVGFGEYGVEDENGHQKGSPVKIVTQFETRKLVNDMDIGGGFFWDAYKWLTPPTNNLIPLYQTVWKG